MVIHIHVSHKLSGISVLTFFFKETTLYTQPHYTISTCLLSNHSCNCNLIVILVLLSTQKQSPNLLFRYTFMIQWNGIILLSAHSVMYTNRACVTS